MTRRLAWSFGATVGLIVGFLAGESVRDGLDLRRLGRPEPRTALSGHTETPEPRIGRETGVQRCGDVNMWSRLACMLDAGHDGDHHAKAREGSQWWWTNVPPLPTQRADEPCTTRSPGGGLTCCRKGTHTAHVFEGAHARDRKDDTDEGIE